MSRDVGLQLFSVRSALPTDSEGTLEKIAEIGTNSFSRLSTED